MLAFLTLHLINLEFIEKKPIYHFLFFDDFEPTFKNSFISPHLFHYFPHYFPQQRFVTFISSPFFFASFSSFSFIFQSVHPQ